MRKGILLWIWSLLALARGDLPDDICDGITVGFLPHPDPMRCTEFVLCVLEEPTVFFCEVENTIFYKPVSDCVPGNPLTCEVFGATTTTTTPPPPPPPPTTTVGVETPTPPIETTTAPIETPAPPPVTTPPPPPPTTEPPPPGQTTPPPPPGETTPQPPLGPPELCVGNNFRYIPDPNSCYRFFFCMFGLALPGECDLDRIFSERWRGCVLGDRETCTSNSPFTFFYNRS